MSKIPKDMRDGVIQKTFWRDGVIGGPSVIVIRQNFDA